MKQLMSGNDAVARGLYEAGCHLVSSYPGTPSTEITECMATYPALFAADTQKSRRVRIFLSVS